MSACKRATLASAYARATPPQHQRVAMRALAYVADPGGWLASASTMSASHAA
jgi:hypothetical protein